MWFARLIMWVIGYPASHTALRYAPTEERWLVHATIGGVQPDWWEFFSKKYLKIKKYRAKFDVGDRALDEMLPDMAHHGYAYLSIIGFFIVIQLRRIGINLKKNPFGDQDKFVCTDVIVKWLNKVQELDPKIKFNENFSEDLTDPKEIDLFLEKSEWFELIKE